MAETVREVISGVPEDKMYADEEPPKIDNIIKSAVIKDMVEKKQDEEDDEEFGDLDPN